MKEYFTTSRNSSRSSTHRTWFLLGLMVLPPEPKSTSPGNPFLYLKEIDDSSPPANKKSTKRYFKKSASKTSNSSNKIPSPRALNSFTIFASTSKAESSNNCNKTGNTSKSSSLIVVSPEKVNTRSWSSSDTPKNTVFSVRTPLIACTLQTLTSSS